MSEKTMLCLKHIEEPYKEVFKLHILGELSLKEISSIYGKSESWARVTFHRAKQKIKERMVEEHIQKCPDCKRYCKSMKEPLEFSHVVFANTGNAQRVSIWKASITHTVLFALYFVIMAVGIAFEAYANIEPSNGFWAFAMIIPATGALWSLVNWYFVRLYPTGKVFRWSTALSYVCFECAALIWWIIHYDIPCNSMLQLLNLCFKQYWPGLVLGVANAVIIVLFSGLYANMIGKE